MTDNKKIYKPLFISIIMKYEVDPSTGLCDKRVLEVGRDKVIYITLAEVVRAEERFAGLGERNHYKDKIEENERRFAHYEEPVTRKERLESCPIEFAVNSRVRSLLTDFAIGRKTTIMERDERYLKPGEIMKDAAYIFELQETTGEDSCQVRIRTVPLARGLAKELLVTGDAPLVKDVSEELKSKYQKFATE